MDLFSLHLSKGRILAAYVKMCEACRELNFDRAKAAQRAMDEELDALSRRLNGRA